MKEKWWQNLKIVFFYSVGSIFGHPLFVLNVFSESFHSNDFYETTAKGKRMKAYKEIIPEVREIKKDVAPQRIKSARMMLKYLRENKKPYHQLRITKESLKADEFSLIHCNETNEVGFDSSKDFVIGEKLQYKHKNRWRICEVRDKLDEENTLLLLIPGKKKGENEIYVNVEKDMMKLRKLGPQDVEEEEEKQKTSKKKVLAAAFRADEMKCRGTDNASVIPLEYFQFDLKKIISSAGKVCLLF